MSGSDVAKPTSVLNKYPTTRDHKINGCWRYLEGRRADDNAEILWRVHDKLYDLDKFIDEHPGGRQWLLLTRGTDITEAFEGHHITPKASLVLKKFYVRDAIESRNYKFTFHEDGFYKTLKRRVAEKLKTIDKDGDKWKSKLILDVNLFAFYLTATLAFRSESLIATIFWTLLAGQCLAWITNFSHNFIHQKDNWRMYTSNLSFVNWRDFRVFHVMSHHMYPNTFADLEVSMYEPHLKWIPYEKKSVIGKYYSYLVSPIVYAGMFYGNLTYRFYGTIWSETKVWYWDEILPLTIPVVMFLFGGTTLSFGSFKMILYIWASIGVIGSFLYGLFAFNNGHHGPKNIHEGDEIENLDFGVYQIRTITDRKEFQGNVFTVLAYFGDHVLHHLFPTLDHSVLPQLQEIFMKTCEEFKIEFEETSIIQALKNQLEQLSRTTDLKKI